MAGMTTVETGEETTAPKETSSTTAVSVPATADTHVNESAAMDTTAVIGCTHKSAAEAATATAVTPIEESTAANTTTTTSTAEAVAGNSLTAIRSVCRFYQENRCRFGSACVNLHEVPVVPETEVEKKPATSRKREEDEEEEGKKKPSMKTAADVIKRIRWDPLLPEVSHHIDLSSHSCLLKYKGDILYEDDI
jgi:hypothetical protein